jgi:chromate transporter
MRIAALATPLSATYFSAASVQVRPSGSLKHFIDRAPWCSAVVLPGLLLVIAALPYWQVLHARASTAALLAGVNAAVVGLLASA